MSDNEIEQASARYVVLREQSEPDATKQAWTVHGNVPANSAEAAIRLSCKLADKPEGTYVAIPWRSWRPVTVKAETTTVLKIEDAK